MHLYRPSGDSDFDVSIRHAHTGNVVAYRVRARSERAARKAALQQLLSRGDHLNGSTVVGVYRWVGLGR